MKTLHSGNERLGKFLFKLLAPLVIMLVLFAYVCFGVFIPKIATMVIEDKKEKIRALAIIARTNLENAYKYETSGKMTRAEAQKYAIDGIRNFRYGTDMKDYFWIVSTTGIMMLNPYKVELENTNQYDMVDKNGKFFIREFIKVAKEKGQGYVEYTWQYYNDPKKIAPKLSYIAYFPKWNWIVGTGLYMNDVEQESSRLEQLIAVFFLIIIFIISIVSFFLILENIKSRKRELQSEKNFWDVFFSSKNPTLIIDDRKIIECNDAAVQIMGYKDKKDLLMKHPSQISPELQPDGRSSYQKANEMFDSTLRNGFNQFEWMHLKANREKLPVVVTMTLLIIGGRQLQHVVWKDLTEENRIQKEKEDMHNHLVQTAKLASIGTLAASVAHELNSPLSILSGYMQLMQSKSMKVENPEEIIERSIIACNRMHKIIDQLRTFARESKKEDWNLININHVIENTLVIMEAKIVKNMIGLSLLLNKNIEHIWGEITQLESVFQNLISNSLDAFENVTDDRKKEITITSLSSVNGKEIVVIYQDNACGMNKDVQEKIFDAFFTTKDIGKGTGLGMSIAREVMEKHKGTIIVESEEGSGTRFVLTLPIDRRQKLK